MAKDKPIDTPKKAPFNNAFDKLGGLKRALAEKDQAAARAAESARQEQIARAHAAQEAAEKTEKAPAVDDQTLFLQAVKGVKRLEADARGEIVKPIIDVPRVAPAVDDETAALLDLASSIDAPVALGAGDEDGPRSAGAVPGFDRKILKRLRAGDFTPEATLDLHGMRRAAAEREVERFVAAGFSSGARCLRVITGVGRHSEAEAEGVLRRALPEWLGRGRNAKAVLAFTTASPKDGGEGAFYVLLRRRGFARREQR